MPASMAGLPGERDGMAGIGRMKINARSASRRACHRAGGVCGEKGARPLGSPRSARLQPRPITTKRAKRSVFLDDGGGHEHGKAPLARGSAGGLS